MGMLMLVMASIQHATAMRRYHRAENHKTISLALVFSFISLIIGMVALIATLLENGPT
jgi:ABC-type lipoprotein release transport system permease subunit